MRNFSKQAKSYSLVKDAVKTGNPAHLTDSNDTRHRDSYLFCRILEMVEDKNIAKDTQLVTFERLLLNSLYVYL